MDEFELNPELDLIPEGEHSPRWRVVEFAIDALIGAVLMALVVMTHRLFYNDDAFITFRYAANLAGGDGLFYHPSDGILATTAPLWASLIGTLSWPLGDVLWAARLLGWLAFGVLGLAAYLLFEHERKGAGFIGLLALALFAFDGPMRLQFGMETHLATGLGLLAIWAHLRCERTWLVGLLLGSMTLLRPDAVFLIALLGLDALLHRRFPWGGLLTLAAILGGWCAIAIPVYGSPVPVTVAAKYHLGQTSSGEFQFLTRLFGVHFEQGWSQWGLIWLALGGLFAGILCGQRSATLVFLWVALHVLAFGLARVEAFDWYYIPLFVALYLGLCEWPLLLMQAIDRGWFDAALRSVLLIVSVALLVVTWRAQPHPPPPMEAPGVPRTRAYWEFAQWLQENAEPDDVLATIEIGVLGFFTDMRVMDLRGLVNPEALEHSVNRNFDWWTTREPLPDFLVLHQPVWGTEGASTAFAAREYLPVMESADVLLLRRFIDPLEDMSDEELRKALTAAIASGEADSLDSLARHFQTTGRTEPAIEALIALCQTSSGSPAVFENLMRQVAPMPPNRLGSERLDAISELALRFGGSADLRLLADGLYREGRHAEALRLLDRSTQLDPEYLPATLDRGRALWRMGQTPEAIELLETLRGQPDVDLWAARLLAHIAEEAERWSDAILLWEACAAGDVPTLEIEAREHLAEIQSELSD